MKRRAVVFIEVDDSAEPGSSATKPLLQFGEGKGDEANYGAFKVSIVPDPYADHPNTPQSIATTLAHELGHVVGAIAGTPKWKADPRTRHDVSALVVKITGQSTPDMQESEREAWELGKVIYPGMDGAAAQRNFFTYFQPAPANVNTNTKARKWLQDKFPSPSQAQTPPTSNSGEGEPAVEGLEGKP